MDFRTELRLPPRQANADGVERRIGVELEFAAVTARDGARLVQTLFGGTIREEDPHRFHVLDTALGKFTCELDTQYVHRPEDDSETEEPAPGSDLFAELLSEFRWEMRRVLGDVSSVIVPCEIVCPPIPISDLPKLHTLLDGLAGAGALGTHSSPLYAFGAHLNVEIATREPAWITALLKAYLLLSDWLRAVMEIHPTRRLAAYVDPFPADYVMKVVDAGYRPNIAQLTDDYLAANPTRNRELDLLPLFAWFDHARVRRAVPDRRIKARPAFHYRLPDAKLGEPGWSLILEWNRWCVAEQLAEKPDLLDAMGAAYQANRGRFMPADWAVKATEWLILS